MRWMSRLLLVVIVVVCAAPPASGQTRAASPDPPGAALFQPGRVFLLDEESIGDADSAQLHFRLDRLRRHLQTSVSEMSGPISSRAISLAKEAGVLAAQSPSGKMSRRMKIFLWTLFAIGVLVAIATAGADLLRGPI